MTDGNFEKFKAQMTKLIQRHIVISILRCVSTFNK